jgi:hypothetical protein
VLNPEQIFSLFGIEMMNLYSLTASTTAKKEAVGRAARKAYEKLKTRVAQVAALLEDAAQAATNAAAAAPHPMVSATPQRQTAETAPEDAGFRAGPLPRPSALPLQINSLVAMCPAVAHVLSPSPSPHFTREVTRVGEFAEQRLETTAPITPDSRSMSTARGTYLPPEASW